MSNTYQSMAKDAAYTAVASLSRHHLTAAASESCTGGLIAKLITDVSGASTVFRGSIVAYADDLKSSLLGVLPETIEKYSAVSEECVAEMAKGTAKLCGCDIAVSAVGLAGPAGGSEEIPVGTVFAAVYSEKYCEAVRLQFPSDLGRDTLRYAAAEAALKLITRAVESYK